MKKKLRSKLSENMNEANSGRATLPSLSHSLTHFGALASPEIASREEETRRAKEIYTHTLHVHFSSSHIHTQNTYSSVQCTGSNRVERILAWREA